ncbi:benzoate 4-monooxygenase cytochrome P450 [Glonium stellatum]|uniref:Benzoate 4-monooxygenase cytochrome P450 n=1 Tax=Glonium stellatum TaxID=574774 RepID=A0A8E2F4G9_9PEZI|nr:benzoate 4-monooxygenase cytochrome P450 [Glonium stellatum]
MNTSITQSCLPALLSFLNVSSWYLVNHKIFVLLMGLAVICIHRLYFHKLSRFPGPRVAACTSLYYMYHMNSGVFPETCERLFKQYKSNVLRVAPNQLVFNEPSAMRQMVNLTDVWKGDFALRVIGFAPTTVSDIKDPQAHRRKRRQLGPGFSNAALAIQEPEAVQPNVNKLIQRIKESVDGVVNLSDYFDCVTTDNVGALAFNADFGMLDRPKDHEFLHVLPDVLRWSVVIQAVPILFKFMKLINKYGPGFMTPTPLRGVVDFSRKHLQIRVQRDAAGEKSNDIMSVILAENEKVPDSEKMGRYELLGEATALVAGGSDTVATALTLIFWHLGQNPSVYQRLVRDVRRAFNTSEEIDSHKAAKISYLKAVMNEAMRVTPVLPGPMWRRADHTIQVGEHLVPPETDMGVVRWCIFRHPKCFNEPTIFKPERWIEDQGDDLTVAQPFGVGPRMCIGRNIALMEMRLIVAKLLWTFDWVPITKQYQNKEYLVQYRGPMLMKATARKV